MPFAISRASSGAFDIAEGRSASSEAGRLIGYSFFPDLAIGFGRKRSIRSGFRTP